MAANNKRADSVRSQVVGEKAERRLEFDLSMIDTENRTVPVVFATPTPVRRWWGEEELAISREAIRGERLDAGAAVLWNHNPYDQIGVVEGWSLDGDKARATLRFSKNSERAEQVFRDIQDKVIRWISVGYRIHGMKLIEERDTGDRWLIDDWEPYEISPVSIPADPNAGIGRSLTESPEAAPVGAGDTGTLPNARSAGDPQPEDDMAAKNESAPDTATAPAAPASPGATAGDSGRSAVEAERSRAAELLRLAETFGSMEVAREYVQTGKSVDEFRAFLLEQRASKPVSEAGRSVTMTERDASKYSFLKVCRYLLAAGDGARAQQRAADEAGFELELHAELERKATNTRGGILVPDEVLRAVTPFNSKVTGPDTGDTGGISIETNKMVGSFIDILRNRTVMMQLGRTMTGLTGNIEIPRQDTKSQGFWVAEDGDATVQNQSLSQLTMTPKTVAAYSEITRKLLMQSSMDIEAFVREDLATGIAETIDSAAIYGTGASNQPRGIKNHVGILAQDFAAVNPTYAELVNMETKIAERNADVNSMAFLFHANQRGALKTTQMFSGTNGMPVWQPGDTVNGYRTFVTNQLTAGDVLFGNFSDFLIGMWGGFEIMADPYTHSLKQRLRIVVFQDVDFLVRRVQSFCWGVRPTP